MDTIKGDIIDGTLYNNDIDYYLNEFTEVYKIDDLKMESQSTWISCLIYINRKLFYKTDLLKDMSTVYGGAFAYNYELLNNICDYYIYICNLYNKDGNIYGFCHLTGIGADTLSRWAKLENENPPAYKIYKKLSLNRLGYLNGKLTDGKQNPVGVIAVLNHYYGWADGSGSDQTPDGGQTTKQLGAKYDPLAFSDAKLLNDNASD